MVLFKEKFGHRRCQNQSCLITVCLNECRTEKCGTCAAPPLLPSHPPKISQTSSRAAAQPLGRTKARGSFLCFASCFSSQAMKALARRTGKTNTGIMAEYGSFHSTAEKEQNNLLYSLLFFFSFNINRLSLIFYQSMLSKVASFSP